MGLFELKLKEWKEVIYKSRNFMGLFESTDDTQTIDLQK